MPNKTSSNATPADKAKQARGKMAHLSGVSSEDQVKRWYENRGAQCLETRWRGQCGEIDLVFQSGEDIIFVEVKSSRTHAQAANSLGPRQIQRLCRAAEEYIGTLPSGSLTPMRIDVALVDGNGSIDVLDNALMVA